MREEDQIWMSYIDAEVRATCETKSWRHQVRRKWSAREKPVAESLLDDYEWKLIPGTFYELAKSVAEAFEEGNYYVLSFDRPTSRFILEHDTSHADAQDEPEIETYTAVRWSGFMPLSLDMMSRIARGEEPTPEPLPYPPVGWLREHLLGLVTRFGPNSFSIT